MRQVLQDIKNGETLVVDVPRPLCKAGGVVVKTAFSLVSAGTERMLVEFGKKNLVQKAKERPDQVAKVLDKLASDGIISTAKAAFGKLAEPLPLGYSAVGEVIEVGCNVEDLAIGDWVVCVGAGYANHAEYNYVPKNLVVKVRDKEAFDMRQGAFVALACIAMQGLRQAEVTLGERVAVIGLGLIGQIAVQLLKTAGCEVIGLDIDSSRLALAEKYADNLILSSDSVVHKVMSLTDGNGCDKIIICAGTSSNEPIELAGRIARDRAIVSVVGAVRMDIPRRDYYQKEITLKQARSYGPGRYDPNYEEQGNDYPIGYVRWTERRNMEAFARLLENGKLELSPLITHEFGIEEATKAYELITDNPNNEKYLGILLSYPDSKALPRKDLAVSVYSEKSVKRAPQIGYGVIGAGAFTRGVMLPAMAKVKNLSPVGISSAKGTSAAIAARKFGFTYATTEYKRLLTDPNVDLVVITTPHNSHAKFVVEALSHGKDVYVEKPLAINEGQLRKIVEYQKRTKRRVFVGYNRRFSPLAKFLKTKLDLGSCPSVIQYTVNAGQIPPEHWIHDPEVGGGRIIGEVCHFVDFMQFLTESVPVEVHASSISGEQTYYRRDDNLVISIRFSDGSTGTILYTAMGSKRYPKERIEVFCQGKVGRVDNFSSATIWTSSRRRKKRFLAQNKGFVEQYVTMYNCLRNDEEYPLSFESAVVTTFTTFDIVKSLRTGKAEQVEIPVE